MDQLGNHPSEVIHTLDSYGIDKSVQRIESLVYHLLIPYLISSQLLFDSITSTLILDEYSTTGMPPWNLIHCSAVIP